MKTLLTILCLLLAAPAPCAERVYGDAAALVVSVYDGDTVKVNILNWPDIIGSDVLIRVYGVDCKEIGSGGEVARDFVRGLLPAGSFVWLRNIKRDKYFRIVADVAFDCGTLAAPTTCDSLSAILIDSNLAVPYFGGTK